MSVKRIAMWSGPRNLSTALMRSFSSRTDCTVVDEPFYAAYLKATGLNHPMKDAILRTYNTDPHEVADGCTKRYVSTKIEYQKHMTHHMLETFDRSFVYKLSNAFLIRSPEKVVKSFKKKIDNFQLNDLGYKQQLDLFNMICDKTGRVPPVVDSDDLCTNPKVILEKLCCLLDISFCDKMLSWIAAPHLYDGIWGSYWYRSVNQSSGFVKPEVVTETPSDFQRNLIEKANPYFYLLNNHKISY